MVLGIWDVFHRGQLENTKHYRAYCLACIADLRPDDATTSPQHYAGINPETDKVEAWFKIAVDLMDGEKDCDKKTDGHKWVLGVKESMVAHLIGKRNACKSPHVTEAAREAAQATSREEAAPSTGSRKRVASQTSDAPAAKRATTSKAVNLQQTTLKRINPVDMGFSDQEKTQFHTLVLRATVSAGLSFRWIQDPEVLALLCFLRSKALDIVPDRRYVAGKLLSDATDLHTEYLKEQLAGKNVTLLTDGWKDTSKNSMAGVHAACALKTYLTALIRTNGTGKDGLSMSLFFQKLVDEAEKTYGCNVRHFVTDNDGGSQWGREDLVEKRPWILENPCIAHQGQLLLGDYFKECVDATIACEQLADLVNWIVMHERVMEIFNVMQTELTGKAALAYLQGNLTRWTTHLVAIHRLLRLKDALMRAVYMKRGEIIAAHVGAQKGRKKKAEMTAAAEAFCDLILDSRFWACLETTAKDLEPIALMTNINQSDSTRADQVVLSLAGLYRHFARHADVRVRNAMTARIEKRWAALDQPMFVFALIFNPFECLARFGDKAAMDTLKLNAELLLLFRRLNTPRPNEPPPTNMAEREKALSTAFFKYTAGLGPWESFKDEEQTLAAVHSGDPTFIWKHFRPIYPHLQELADIALLLLGLTCHQAGNERTFSVAKAVKTDKRNKMAPKTLERVCKLNAQIRHQQQLQGVVTERTKRANHDPIVMNELLAVPRYVDALSDDDSDDAVEDQDRNDNPTAKRLTVVRSSAAWRRELRHWTAASDADELVPDSRASSRTGRKFFPRSLDLLFGTTIPRQQRERRPDWSREELLMQLLADEEEGEEIVDDGEKDGSEDDYVE